MTEEDFQTLEKFLTTSLRRCDKLDNEIRLFGPGDGRIEALEHSLGITEALASTYAREVAATAAPALVAEVEAFANGDGWLA